MNVAVLIEDLRVASLRFPERAVALHQAASALADAAGVSAEWAVEPTEVSVSGVAGELGDVPIFDNLQVVWLSVEQSPALGYAVGSVQIDMWTSDMSGAPAQARLVGSPETLRRSGKLLNHACHRAARVAADAWDKAGGRRG